GSPTINRLPTLWRTTPGCGVEHARGATAPTIPADGIAPPIRPSRSTERNGKSRCTPASPWKNHHGTPFIAVTTAVSGPASAPPIGATLAIALLFPPTT